jgi:hypothetical protein
MIAPFSPLCGGLTASLHRDISGAVFPDFLAFQHYSNISDLGGNTEGLSTIMRRTSR